MGYLDNAGLYVKIGPEVAVPSVGGEYKTYAELREIELTLNLTAANYPFGATNYIVNDNLVLPTGVRIQEVETYVDTVAAGATATLDVGLMRTDRTTVTSANGLIAAKTVASMVAGEKVVFSAPGGFGGALIGTNTSSVNYFTVRVNTASFTSGVIKIRIRYYRP